MPQSRQPARGRERVPQARAGTGGRVSAEPADGVTLAIDRCVTRDHAARLGEQQEKDAIHERQRLLEMRHVTRRRGTRVASWAIGPLARGPGPGLEARCRRPVAGRPERRPGTPRPAPGSKRIYCHRPRTGGSKREACETASMCATEDGWTARGRVRSMLRLVAWPRVGTMLMNGGAITTPHAASISLA